MKLGPVIPILRMFDVPKAHEFYLGFLGFGVDWEHRFEPDTPLYTQVSRDGCVLHLSEHHGDASPGAIVRIGIEDIDALHAELTAKHYRYGRPGVETMPWGLRELAAHDPFGNRLIFYAEP